MNRAVVFLIALAIPIAAYAAAPPVAVTAVDSGGDPVRIQATGSSLNVNVTGGTAATPPTGASATQVQGTQAGAATRVGNPVTIGGEYNTTLPTYTDGQATEAQYDTRGGQYMVIKGDGSTVAATAVNVNSDDISYGAGLRTASQSMVFDGTDGTRMRGDSTGLYVHSPKPATIDTSATGQTADFTVEAATANLRIKGWSIREDAGTPAVATVVLRHDADGTCDSTAVVAFIELDANQSSSMDYGSDGLAIASGLCADVIAGSVSFVAHLKTEANL